MKHKLSGKTVTIGRDASSDIQLTEKEISRKHISIREENGAYFLTDLSTNGTFVNNEKVEEKELAHNDRIVIGEWNIIFENFENHDEQKTVIKESSQTNIIRYEVKKKELITEEIELRFKDRSGKSGKYTLSKATIGSDPDNDIVITGDDYMSAHHCVITNENGKFQLEDHKSKNGTFLKGEPIKKEFLPESGEITVGQTVIKFVVKKRFEKIKPAAETSLGPVIGRSQKMREIFSLLKRISSSEVPVCIAGESGTGKEVVARFIHESGKREKQPFVAVNCGAIPFNLIESELFGHEKGSFTSATSQHKGVFEQANTGTLFLDEIGEMPLDLQTRLLRVLETGMIKRVGSQNETKVNVRIIAATNKDLKKMVAEGKFREDLFYRLYVVPVILPPLRERKEDIEPLSLHFIETLASDEKALSRIALKKMVEYDWPGNIRELKNTVQRAILTSEDFIISEKDIVFSSLDDAPVIPTYEEAERKLVVTALKASAGNISDAAKILAISRGTLHSMVDRFHINLDEFKQ